MGILVNKNEFFDLEIKGNFIIDQFERVIGFKKSEIGSVTLVCKYRGRDFETMSKIIEDSSIINSVNGKPLIRSGVFTKLILLNFFREINVVSENESASYIVDKDLVNQLNYDIVKYLAQKWLELTNGI